MLNILSTRADLGKNVTTRQKNNKDDSEKIIEFSIAGVKLALEDLTALVACSKHERKFSEVAFRARNAMSELRHFKPLPFLYEVLSADIRLQLADSAAEPIEMEDCAVKGIKLTFAGEGTTFASFRVWAPFDKQRMYALSSWAPAEVYIAVLSPGHGEEEKSNQPDLHLVQ